METGIKKQPWGRVSAERDPVLSQDGNEATLQWMGRLTLTIDYLQKKKQDGILLQK